MGPDKHGSSEPSYTPRKQVSILVRSFRPVYIPPGETIGPGVRMASDVGVTGGRLRLLVPMGHKAIIGLSSSLLSARLSRREERKYI